MSQLKEGHPFSQKERDRERKEREAARIRYF